MRALFLASILIVPAAASADQPVRRVPAQAPAPAPAPAASTPQNTNCQAPGIRHADRDTRQATRPQSLGELPPGNLYLTVQREVDGCVEPVLVRQGFGNLRPRN